MMVREVSDSSPAMAKVWPSLHLHLGVHLPDAQARHGSTPGLDPQGEIQLADGGMHLHRNLAVIEHRGGEFQLHPEIFPLYAGGRARPLPVVNG